MEGRQLWPGWDTVRVLGSGGFGKVYEICKADDTGGYHSALKVISIPASPDEYQYYKDDGYDNESITSIFKSQMEDVVSEFALMSKFKGVSNIVSYEDHMVVPHQNGIGWDILIRMELLMPLTQYCSQRLPGVDEVTKLACDICRALELCERRHIVHRDIKPQNIFVNEFGDFKLGDFGIANTMDHTTRATKIGTYNYMAPEVYMGKPYGKTVDLYSLGLVLFWLLNERRLPFVPVSSSGPTPSQNNDAQVRRFGGEPIPAPRHGNDRLNSVIQKACAFCGEDRFQSAREMRMALSDAAEAIIDIDPQPPNGRTCPWCKGEKWESLLSADLITYHRAPCKICGGNGMVSSGSDVEKKLDALRQTPQYQEAGRSCPVCRGLGWLHIESGQLFPCPFCLGKPATPSERPSDGSPPERPKINDGGTTKDPFDDPTGIHKKPGPKSSPKNFRCISCGASVSKANTRCEVCEKKHAFPPRPKPQMFVCPHCQGDGVQTFVAQRHIKKRFGIATTEKWFFDDTCSLCGGKGKVPDSIDAQIIKERYRELRRKAAIEGIALPQCPVCRGLGEVVSIEYFETEGKAPLRKAMDCPKCFGEKIGRGKKPENLG